VCKAEKKLAAEAQAKEVADRKVAETNHHVSLMMMMLMMMMMMMMMMMATTI